jgi:prepilin-type N-terminal cleavage/methylation domain-containing protein
MSKTDARGLTLLEVILALVIIGMGVAFLSTATSRCLALVTQSKIYHQARYALEMASLKYPIVEIDGELVNKEVSDTEILPGFLFTRTAEAPEDYEDAGLFILRNRVTWESTSSNNFEETFRYFYYTNDLTEEALNL